VSQATRLNDRRFAPEIVALDISAASGPRVVRARPSAPVDFRRGGRSTRLREERQDALRRRRPIGRGRVGFDFWASAPVCGPRSPLATSSERDRLTMNRDPALGFVLLQGFRARVGPCIGRARPRFRSPVPGAGADHVTRVDSYPLVGLRRFLPVTIRAPARAARPTARHDCEVA
jgi:hypothetical protein